MANRLYNKQTSPKGYKAGGRVKKMGGGMMKKRSMLKAGSSNPKAKMSAKNKKLAAMYPPKDKVTRGDVITAAKMKNKKGMA
jgi:hypothetical protein